MCIYALFMCFLPFLPNDVYGLAKQYGLKEGTKLSCDNLFTSFDLCAEKGIGVIGTVRQNRIGSLPIMDKKTADKQLKRGGEVETVFNSNICLSVWKDSKPRPAINVFQSL